MDEQQWRESLVEGDRVVVKESGCLDKYFEGVVECRTPNAITTSMEGSYLRVTFSVETGQDVRKLSEYSIVPPDDEAAIRFFLQDQIRNQINVGALSALSVAELKELLQLFEEKTRVRYVEIRVFEPEERSPYEEYRLNGVFSHPARYRYIDCRQKDGKVQSCRSGVIYEIGTSAQIVSEIEKPKVHRLDRFELAEDAV